MRRRRREQAAATFTRAQICILHGGRRLQVRLLHVPPAALRVPRHDGNLRQADHRDIGRGSPGHRLLHLLVPHRVARDDGGRPGLPGRSAAHRQDAVRGVAPHHAQDRGAGAQGGEHGQVHHRPPVPRRPGGLRLQPHVVGHSRDRRAGNQRERPGGVPFVGDSAHLDHRDARPAHRPGQRGQLHAGLRQHVLHDLHHVHFVGHRGIRAAALRLPGAILLLRLERRQVSLGRFVGTGASQHPAASLLLDPRDWIMRNSGICIRGHDHGDLGQADDHVGRSTVLRLHHPILRPHVLCWLAGRHADRIVRSRQFAGRRAQTPHHRAQELPAHLRRQQLAGLPHRPSNLRHHMHLRHRPNRNTGRVRRQHLWGAGRGAILLQHGVARSHHYDRRCVPCVASCGIVIPNRLPLQSVDQCHHPPVSAARGIRNLLVSLALGPCAQAHRGIPN
mmetsp:Transcript_1955/g.4809  ORF Transcript_1955/g.4809 Transcript_1955/m.4809 type:complete len:447 (-) Transcript_1955:260-1600(-)